MNARSFTTAYIEKFTIWTKVIDGGEDADGYLTLSTALTKGDKDPKALPDYPLFLTTESNPEVLLNYSNNNSISNLTIVLLNSGNFMFFVQAGNY